MNPIIFQDLQEIYNQSINWEQFRNCTVLITGPNGMLASYIMYMFIYLNKEKYMNIHILAMARSKEHFTDRFGKYANDESIILITDSIIEPIYIEGPIDYIIHAASFASPQYYDVCPVDVLSPNVIGTYYLLRLAVEKKTKGFLMFSTGDVYGKISGKPYITENDMGVIDPLDIHSCYSESKRMAETMCYSFKHQYGVPVKIARIWHTYAPTMNIYNDPRVFASFMKNIILGQDIEIKSDGTGKRTFCYISDAISAFFLILTRGKDGEAYNICNTDQFVSIRQLATMLAQIRTDINIHVSWKKRSSDEHYVENTAIGTIAPSNEKLKRLGWDPQINIQEGFTRVYEYLTLSSATEKSERENIFG